MAILRILLLGPLVVLKDDQPLVFSYDKVRALLAYLAAEPDRPVLRARLADLLWPDQSQTAAQDSLRQAISRLRAVIDDQNAQPPYLIVARDYLQINRNSTVSIDLGHFQGYLARAAAHRHRSLASCPLCAGYLDQASQLVRGNFLEDLYLPDGDAYETWATTYREQVKIQLLQSLNTLAEYSERQGRAEDMLKYAARQIEIDAYNEAAHCQMMRALAHSGQRSQAVAHFQQVKKLLEEELGVAPAQETLVLYEDLKHGHSFAQQSARNLPAPLTTLVGRSVELSELGVWLADPGRRLISVVGPGGVGKTRLVNQAIRAAVPMFAQGAVYADLSHGGPSVSPTAALAEALGLPPGSSPDLWSQVMAYLRGRELLLVLDGFEHIRKEREQVTQLLEANPGLVVLVTSRERLNLPGEWVFALGGLDVPPPSIQYRLEAYSAVEMFCQFARQGNQTFALSESNRQAVGDICRLVGGMPLAILLAAAWTRSLQCQQIAQEIQHSLDFLSTGTEEDAHTSVRAVFEQSWKMLAAAEQAVFARLSVFRGGFDHAAAEGVASASLDSLTRLVDKSLLRVTAEGRYDLHDLMIQFGMEKLGGMGEEETTRRQHFDYFFGLAEQHEYRLNHERNFDSFIWLVRESANLREAIAWATTQHSPQDSERAQKASGLLYSDIHQDGLHVLIRKGHLRSL